MNTNYNECLDRLLKSEGVYTNNPSDTGGPTNFGITLKDYQMYINKNGTAEDVRNMNINDAKKIYKTRYWDALKCDSLPSGVDYTVFDYGVNSGVGRAKKVLSKFSCITDPSKLIVAINDERLTFLQSLKTWPVFGRGWAARVASVKARSLQLASNKNSPATSVGLLGGIAAAGVGTYHFTGDHKIAITIGALVIVFVLLSGFVMYINKEKDNVV